jgi:cytochrome c oxidase subunit 4
MEKGESNVQQAGQAEHIVSYQDHFSTWAGLIFLTIMTATVSVYGADLYTTAILTALVIATTKSLVVAYYFMHLKYDMKIYRFMIAIALVLFVTFVILTMIDYLFRR